MYFDTIAKYPKLSGFHMGVRNPTPCVLLPPPGAISSRLRWSSAIEHKAGYVISRILRRLFVRVYIPRISRTDSYINGRSPEKQREMHPELVAQQGY
jgi:hypothetical protein